MTRRSYACVGCGRKKAQPVCGKCIRQVSLAARAKEAEKFIVGTNAMQTALRDAVAYMDRFRRGEAGWTAADVKRLEELRALSVF